jgi:Winged helix DNA-binding domain
MAGDLLGRRALNRATLERQLLLRRWDLEVTEAVERLAGLNAQDPEPPYLGLWARLAGFRHDALTKLLEDRGLVRSTLLRGTQHLVAAADYLAWRPLLQPMLERRQRGGLGRPRVGVDPADLVAATRELLAERPLTRPELGRLLAESWPGEDPVSLGWSAQYLVPLIHPPPSGTWRTRGAILCALAESWLGRPLDPDPSAAGMIRRHLAAFGPASVMDIQAWSGLTRLREPVDRLGAELRPFRDQHGRRLYDLPDAPRPDPDTPAPARFLPAVDNLLLAHADRTRVITDERRRRVCVGAVVEPTVLVDGEVVAIWRIVWAGGTAVLEVEPLGGLSGADRAGVAEEGMRLLEFAAADAGDHDVRFAAAGQLS